MLEKYLSIIRNYVLSVFSQEKYTIHPKHASRCFRTNARNTVGRTPSMVGDSFVSQSRSDAYATVNSFSVTFQLSTNINEPCNNEYVLHNT